MARYEAPQKRADMAAVDHRRLPVDPPGPVKPAQQLAMHGYEHAGALPLREAPMRRGRRAGNTVALGPTEAVVLTSNPTRAVDGATRSR